MFTKNQFLHSIIITDFLVIAVFVYFIAYLEEK